MSNAILSETLSQATPQHLTQKTNWVNALKGVFIGFTLVLLILTGKVQFFSCYPMVTGGDLPKTCSRQGTNLQVIQNQRTQGIVLLKWTSSPDLDADALRAAFTTLVQPHVGLNADLRTQIKRNIASNPNTPTDVLEPLAESEDPVTLAAIVARSDVNSEVLRAIASTQASQAVEIQRALAENPKTPISVLQKLTASTDFSVLYKIATSKQVSPEILDSVASNPASQKIEIQRAIAKNLATSEKLLQKLSSVQDVPLLVTIIKHPNTSERVLDAVGNNPSVWKSYIPFYLAEKSTLSHELLAKLMRSEDPGVLDRLLRNSNEHLLSSKERDELLGRMGRVSVVPSPSEPPIPESENSEQENEFPTTKPCQQNKKFNSFIGFVAGMATGVGVTFIPFIGPEIAIVVAPAVFELTTGALNAITNCPTGGF